MRHAIQTVIIGCGVIICSAIFSTEHPVDQAKSVIKQWKQIVNDSYQQDPLIETNAENKRNTHMNVLEGQYDDALHQLEEKKTVSQRAQRIYVENLLDVLGYDSLLHFAQMPVLSSPLDLQGVYHNSGFPRTRRKWPRNQELKEVYFTIAALRHGIRDCVSEFDALRKQVSATTSKRRIQQLQHMYKQAYELAYQVDMALAKYVSSGISLKPVPPQVRARERNLEVSRGKFPTNPDTKNVVTIVQLANMVHPLEEFAYKNDVQGVVDRVPNVSCKVKSWGRW